MARRPQMRCVQDGFGNALASATVTVSVHSTGLAATIYEDEVGGSAVSGSAVDTDSTGYFEFWLDDSDYSLLTLFDLVITKTGYTTRTLTVAI